MAISLGTSLTPYMGRGRPKVVITGKFALGIVDGPDEETIDGTTYKNVCYYMKRLFLDGLAVASPGHTFFLNVRNRTSSGDVSGPGYGGRDPFDPNEAYPVSYGTSGLASLEGLRPAMGSSFPNADLSGSVRLVDSYSGKTGSSTQDKTFFAHNDSREDSIAAALAGIVDGSNPVEINGYARHIGEVLLPNIVITLTGKLGQLDLTRIRAGDARHSDYGAVMDTPSALPDGKVYDDPVHGPGNGWVPGEVHIFDNPQLRGHVTVPQTRAPRIVWDA